VSAPLKGGDQKTWAVAQGPLAVGGFLIDAGAASERKNHVAAARIPGGATVEGTAPTPLPKREVVLLLREPDFTTAVRIAAAITAALGPDTATARDAGAVIVPLGQRWRGDVAGLIATIEPLTVEPDQVARVVIDERTGTVVIGGEVALRPVAIAYGGLTVQISEQPEVSQPAPLGRGKTTVVPRTEAIVTEVAGDLHALPAAATLSELTTALNRLGVKPRDLIAILAALRAAGALRAEVEVL
jgi:flagellar P-ring protein precursor FlgI